MNHKKNKLALFCTLVMAFSLFGPRLHVTGRADASGSEETVTIPREEYERLKRYELLDEASQYIENYFYEEPDTDAMKNGALSGMLDALGDPYTFYYPPEAWEKLWEDDEGRYAGIGVQMLGDYENASVTVTRVFRGTPAEAAGIRRGDVFYRVEDLTVTTATLQDAVHLMRGVPGESVHVEVLRSGEILSFDIVKAEILVNRVESVLLEGGIGCIALYEFAGDIADAFEEDFRSLLNRGMRALILDLRDNPGGWVSAGVRVADHFLDRQLLFYAQDREGNREDTYTREGSNKLPLVILINGHSASTSEILCAAMKDHGRATLVGTRTFGKGTMQDVRMLGDLKSGMQFTFARFFSPLGNPIHKAGVLPDLVVEMPEELGDVYFEPGDLSDPQTAAAYREALRLLGIQEETALPAA